jgi:hypothetical protein
LIKRKLKSLNKTYAFLDLIMTIKGRNSVEARGVLAILAGLPASGAKSVNFTNCYITVPNGWKNFPTHAEDILLACLRFLLVMVLQGNKKRR